MENLISTENYPNVLFVDDEISVLNSLKRFSRKKNWIAHTASSAEDALQSIEQNDFDVIVSDMRMPGMKGDEFLERVKRLSPNTVRILLTGYSDMKAMESVINNAKVYNYVTKPWDEIILDKIVNEAIHHHAELSAHENNLDKFTNQNKKLSKLALLLDKQVKERSIEVNQAMSILEGLDKQVKERSMEVNQALGLLEGLNEKAEQNFKESLSVLTLVLEWKEGRDAGHLDFVSNYGVKIAQYLKLSQSDIDKTELAGNLHRIGMLCLPDELRQRPIFSFDADEKKLYQKHPVWGEMALSTAQSLAPIGKIIRHQNEAVNGTGCPDRLCDKDIPIISKILAVVSDFYDAHNGRLERSISGINDAKNYINEWAGKKYDVDIVAALWELLGDFGKDEARKMTMASGDLEADMTVECDIVSASGTILLTHGTILTSTTINKLIEFEEKYNEKLNISVELSDKSS